MDKYFFKEWVFFDSEDEKKDAEKYLDLWKKFIIKKNQDLRFVDDQIIERDFSHLNSRKTLGIKIEMEKKYV